MIAEVMVPVVGSLAALRDRRDAGGPAVVGRGRAVVNLAATPAGSAAYAVGERGRVEDELAVAVGLDADVRHRASCRRRRPCSSSGLRRARAVGSPDEDAGGGGVGLGGRLGVDRGRASQFSWSTRSQTDADDRWTEFCATVDRARSTPTVASASRVRLTPGTRSVKVLRRRGRRDPEAHADLGVRAGADGGAAEQVGAVGVGQGERRGDAGLGRLGEQPVAAVGDLDRGGA